MNDIKNKIDTLKKQDREAFSSQKERLRYVQRNKENVERKLLKILKRNCV